MDEIKELIKQRNEINAKIRELQDLQKSCGRVMYEKFVGWNIYDGLQIRVKTITSGKDKSFEKWKSIIVGESTYEVISGIETMIKDLEAMKERLKVMQKLSLLE